MDHPEPLPLFEDDRIWTIEVAHAHLAEHGPEVTRRTAERRLHELRILPEELGAARLQDEWGRRVIALVLDSQMAHARARRKLVLFAQLHALPSGRPCLHFNDARGTRLWIPLPGPQASTPDVAQALARLQAHLAKDILVFPHLQLAALCRGLPASAPIDILAYPPKADLVAPLQLTRAEARSAHLARLEAESMHVLREAIAEAQAPVMLYSIGKDSSVLLHLARKAFFPSLPPFPLLHVDTRWKFRQMYEFRDRAAKASGMELIVHTNPEAISKDINPFDHGSSLHTHITKTEGLKQALDAHNFDVILGGARRDEEKSRAKERIFSFRTASHTWDPKKQRPELWNLYNVRKNSGESIRVFPLSNWTELDIWQYISQENIPVVPLYFAQLRPVVVRDGALIMVDDDRMRLNPGEAIQARSIRFRTLGCYPLTGAVESTARTLPEIIAELINTTHSERQGRVIDSDAASSMEKKKQEGYF